MQKLQLYIANERIDLFKDEQVSFNQSIQNIKDPAKIFTEFTQTFTVPASKSNNKIFKHYYNFNIVGGFDARNKVDAEIELNNIAFKQGYIRLDGVDLKLNKPYAYRITFFGETVNLKDILAEEKLASLAGLAEYNLDYNSASVQARLQSSASGGAILCPLINSGASGQTSSRLYYNSGGHGTDVTGNLWYQQGSHEHGVYWKDLKYAIRLYEVVEAITTNYPTLVFTDDFFSTSNPEFYNLYMWLHRKKGNVEPASQITTSPTLVDEFGANATVYTNMISGSGLQVYASFNPLTNTVTSLPNIQQDLVLTITGNPQYDVIINRNGAFWIAFNGVTGNNTFTKSDYPTPMDEATYTVVIRSTTNLTFTSIEWELAGNLAGGGWAETYTASNFPATTTFQFIIQEQIPDIKIIDFLNGLFKMFNLTAYYVSNRQDADYGKIKVQKLDDFYTAGTSYDISEYVDTNTSQVNVALPYREIEFGYEGTGTLLALQYEQLNGKTWGSEEYTGDTIFDAPNPIYKVKLPFEHMQFERLIDANENLSSPTNITTIQWGYFVDDNQDAYFGKPLLFYPILQTGSGITSISFRDSLETHVELDSYYIPSNSLALSSATSTINTNFYQEFNEYGQLEIPSDTGFTGTLFQENYLEYIQDIFNSKKRLTKLKAYLPLKIIYKLNMNDRVVINNQSYNINNLTTNLITGESSMELLNNNYIGNVSGNFRVLTDVYQTYPNYSDYYYDSLIGDAQNLSNGDVIYTDQALTTTLAAGTYYQEGSSETTTRCTDSSYLMSMTVNSSGVITNILCGQP